MRPTPWIILLCAASAPAQVADPALDRVAEQLESEPEGPVVPAVRIPRSDPVRPSDPGRVVLPGVEPGRLLHEGTFVGRQSGVLLAAPTGELFMVFGGEGESALEPMVLLPCQTLAQMAKLLERETPPVLLVGGEITTYRGRNYLLPTVFGVRPIGETEEEPEPAPPPDTQDDPLGADPRVEELLTEILTRDRVPRGLVPTAAEEQEGGMREGELLIRRRGRLARLAGGEWAFTFDNDADAGDVPLVLLPCQMMQRVENVGGSETSSVELSGRVYAYEGRRYVLPTLFRVLPASDLEPLQ